MRVSAARTHLAPIDEPRIRVPVGFPGAAMARVAETMMLTDCDSQIGIEPWGELEEVLRGLPCAVMIARRR